MEKQFHKITIVGGGPVGATLSLYLCKAKIPHTIIQKGDFSKEKICSGALTPEVYRVLNDLNPAWLQEFMDAPWSQPSSGIYIGNENKLGVNLGVGDLDHPIAFSHNVKRLHFDPWVFSKIDPNYAQIHLNTEVEHISRTKDQILIRYQSPQGLQEHLTSLLIGADGDHSLVRKTLHPNGNRIKRAHTFATVRQYWKGIQTDQRKTSELYTLRKPTLLAAWIVHLPNGESNVGIGGLSDLVAKHKVNLKKELENFILHDPRMQIKFRDAERISKVEGWPIPLNTAAKDYTGDQYLLIGDAAKFPERLYGKGIGIGMLAAQTASKVIQEAIKENDFSYKKLKTFEIRINARFGKEWKKLYWTERLASNRLMHQIILRLLKLPLIRKRLEKDIAQKVRRSLSR